MRGAQTMVCRKVCSLELFRVNPEQVTEFKSLLDQLDLRLRRRVQWATARVWQLQSLRKLTLRL